MCDVDLSSLLDHQLSSLFFVVASPHLLAACGLVEASSRRVAARSRRACARAVTFYADADADAAPVARSRRSLGPGVLPIGNGNLQGAEEEREERPYSCTSTSSSSSLSSRTSCLVVPLVSSSTLLFARKNQTENVSNQENDIYESSKRQNRR